MAAIGTQVLPAWAQRAGTVINIDSRVDRKYRAGLAQLVATDGNAAARWHITNALRNGPSKRGYVEAAAFFGDEFDLKLKLTAPIVEACEVSMPGFGRWLEITGFGNDKTMIKGFVAWAEHKNGKGRVLTEIGDRAIYG